MDAFNTLREMSIFSGVADATIHQLIKQGEVVSIKAGEFFFREGSAADSMFLVEQGEAAVIKSWRGRGYVLKEFGPGDVFGEMALLDLRPRSAAIRALSDCQALAVKRSSLEELQGENLPEYTAIQINLGREVCRRLRETDKLLFQNLAESKKLPKQEPTFG